MALVDYGPIKRRDVSMGAGLDSLCTEADGFAAADTVIGNSRVVGVIGTSCSVTNGFRGITGAISGDEFGDCGTGRVDITHHTDFSVTGRRRHRRVRVIPLAPRLCGRGYVIGN